MKQDIGTGSISVGKDWLLHVVECVKPELFKLPDFKLLSTVLEFYKCSQTESEKETRIAFGQHFKLKPIFF